MSELKKYTKAEVAEHKSFKDGKKDVWCIFEGKVYDISSFIEDHPGGEEVLLDRAGDDMTQQFADIGHSDYARQLMKGMLLGELDGASAAASPSPASAAAEKPKPVASASPASASSAKPAKNSESTAMTLVIPIGIILISVLVYMYLGRVN
eukprot:TRINITY_DN345_c0_g1_i2.p1 TRINITY_DN345_c0_g1~~TRINITY_DN345_c0_g1_i2.p1  ORF type:complete len:151 (+),score=51.60 TRINITY_DN345_c0_g1_i2:214-666(+)